MDDTFMDVNRRLTSGWPSAVRVIEVAEAEACCPSVLASPLDASEAAELAKGFTALADPVRLRVLSASWPPPTPARCACATSSAPLGKSQPTVSHHLKILSEAGPGPRRPARQMGVVLPRPQRAVAALRAAIDA